MSLDVSKLQTPHTRNGKTIARCPACAEVGGDNKKEHLFINADGKFGCVVYPGNSADAVAHRRRIFALVGVHERESLKICKTPIFDQKPIKTGIRGRMGRVKPYLALYGKGQNTCNDISNDISNDVSNDVSTGIGGETSPASRRPRDAVFTGVRPDPSEASERPNPTSEHPSSASSAASAIDAWAAKWLRKKAEPVTEPVKLPPYHTYKFPEDPEAEGAVMKAARKYFAEKINEERGRAL